MPQEHSLQKKNPIPNNYRFRSISCKVFKPLPGEKNVKLSEYIKTI